MGRSLAALLTLIALVLAWRGDALAAQDAVRVMTVGDAARVLVELRVAAAGDPEAIAAVQRDVLARLGQAGVTVVRRYRTVAMMALEVDAAALAKLTHMGDLVIRVIPEGASRTQEAR